MLKRVGCRCCCQLNQLKDYFWMRGYLSCIYGGDAESSFRHSNGWTYESDVKLSEGDVGRWRLISNGSSKRPDAMSGDCEYR